MKGERRESISATLTVFLFPVRKKYASVFGLSQLVLSGVVAIIVHVALKEEQIYLFFMIWFSPGVPLAEKKNINANKHDSLRSMKQKSCLMHH